MKVRTLRQWSDLFNPNLIYLFGVLIKLGAVKSKVVVNFFS